MQLNDKGWSIIPLRACRAKIAHAFQYHIRKAFSQNKSIPVSSNRTDDVLKSRSEELLSSHTRTTEDHQQAKASWIHAQQPDRDLTISFNSIGNSLHFYRYQSNFHQTESLGGETDEIKHGRESPYPLGILHCVVSPFEEQKIAQSFLFSHDSTMKDRHVSIIPSERINCCPVRVNEFNHHYDTSKSLPNNMPNSTLPNLGAKAGIRPYRPLAQHKSTHGDSVSAHTSASVLDFPDPFERNTSHNIYHTESFSNPISERANCYFIENTNSFDYYRQKHGSQNQYQNNNSTDEIDTPTSPGRTTTRFDSHNSLSDFEADLIDDGKLSHISTFDTCDFDLDPTKT